MTTHPPKPVPLPLTEHASGSRVPGVDEQTVQCLVDAFYGSARRDDLLGPIFHNAIKDWSLHLLTMYDFWSAVVLRSSRYSGRPIDAHARLEGLERAHFARWLAIWEATVEREVPAESRDAFIVPARRMAETMAMRLCAR
ncbi:MAG: hypothetical protein Kow0022_14610 [Phycisphaerales bacterium]